MFCPVSRFILLLLCFNAFSVKAQTLPITYSYHTTFSNDNSPKEVLSVYQSPTFSIMQRHDPSKSPDFIPSNYFEFKTCGYFSDQKSVSLRRLGNRKIWSYWQIDNKYKPGMVIPRMEMGHKFYQVKFSGFKLEDSGLHPAENVDGLTTQMISLHVHLEFDKEESTGKSLEKVEEEVDHKIWVSEKIPYDEIARAILDEPASPDLIKIPKNFYVNNNPRRDLCEKVYQAIDAKLKPLGMIVKMSSTYTMKSNGDTKTSNTTMTIVGRKAADKLAFDPDDYLPVVSRHTLNILRSVVASSQFQVGQGQVVGSAGLSFEKDKFNGKAVYQNSKGFFSIQMEMKNKGGQKFNLCFLTVSKDLPKAGNQPVSDIPVADIRSELKEKHMDVFYHQVFVSGYTTEKDRDIYFIYPLEGEISFDQVSEGLISGTFKLKMKEADLRRAGCSYLEGSLEGSFSAKEAER